jgi:hypothetical protein
MPSVLNVDTLVAANGTDPVTLTKQSAAKAWLFTTDKATYVPDNSLNISTVTDNGVGRVEPSFSNSFANANIAGSFDVGFNRSAGSYNTDGGITTSSYATYILVPNTGAAADVAGAGGGYGYIFHGDLA